MLKNLTPQPTPIWKTNTAGWHDAEKDSKTPSLLNQFGKPAISPANRTFAHGAILFLLSQPPQDTIRRGDYFLCNNVEEKITERRFVAPSNG